MVSKSVQFVFSGSNNDLHGFSEEEKGDVTTGCLEDLKLFGDHFSRMSLADQKTAMKAIENILTKLESQQ